MDPRLCLFVSATVSNPYNIAGLTAYTSPFTLDGTRQSQTTPDILLHPIHPACSLFFTSLPHSPLLCTDWPSHLKSSTFATSSPCIFTVPLTCLSFTHIYSVLLLCIDFHSSSLQNIYQCPLIRARFRLYVISL